MPLPGSRLRRRHSPPSAPADQLSGAHGHHPRGELLHPRTTSPTGSRPILGRTRSSSLTRSLTAYGLPHRGLMAVTSVACLQQDHEGLVVGLSAAAAPALGVPMGAAVFLLGHPSWLGERASAWHTPPRPSRLPSLGRPRRTTYVGAAATHTRRPRWGARRRGRTPLSFGSFGVIPCRLLGPTRPF